MRQRYIPDHHLPAFNRTPRALIIIDPETKKKIAYTRDQVEICLKYDSRIRKRLAEDSSEEPLPVPVGYYELATNINISRDLDSKYGMLIIDGDKVVHDGGGELTLNALMGDDDDNRAKPKGHNQRGKSIIESAPEYEEVAANAVLDQLYRTQKWQAKVGLDDDEGTPRKKKGPKPGPSASTSAGASSSKAVEKVVEDAAPKGKEKAGERMDTEKD